MLIQQALIRCQMKKNILFFLISIIIVGCGEVEKVEKSASGLDRNSGLIKYLSDEPAVKNINDWNSDFGKGLVVETNNYRIYTTLRDPLMLRQVPGFVESAYKGYQKQLPEPVSSETLFEVYLFADREQWEKFTKKFTGEYSEIYLKIDKGAYYLNGACVAYNIGRKQTFSVLGHEGWHQFSSRHFKYRLPSWLDEGIAMHFEQSRYRSGFFQFTPAKNLNRLGGLKLALMEGRMMPIEQLIMTNPGQVLFSGDQKDSAFYYAQMYSLVRFLRESNYCKRLPNYNAMLMGAIKGSWPLNETARKMAADRNLMMTGGTNAVMSRELFEIYIGDDYETIWAEYLNFCRKITKNIYLK